MIKIEDLRSGNLFYVNNRIQEITPDEINYIWQCSKFGMQLDGFRAILITPEMLVRYGFESVTEKTSYDLFKKGDAVICYRKGGSSLYDIQTGRCIGKEFTAMHQLQNIIYSLYGLELE